MYICDKVSIIVLVGNFSRILERNSNFSKITTSYFKINIDISVISINSALKGISQSRKFKISKFFVLKYASES